MFYCLVSLSLLSDFKLFMAWVLRVKEIQLNINFDPHLFQLSLNIVHEEANVFVHHIVYHTVSKFGILST